MAMKWLFCGCKLGWSWESCCYSRLGLFSSTFPLSLSLLRPSSSVWIPQLSLEKKRCGVHCCSFKRQRQHRHFPLIPQPVGFVCVCECVCIFCISPPDHISFNTTALARCKLVELVLQIIVCLWGKLCFTDAAETTQLADC